MNSPLPFDRSLVVRCVSFCLLLAIWPSPVSGQLFQRASTKGQSFHNKAKQFFDSFRPKNNEVPAVYEQAPSLNTLIADLNARSTRVRQLENRGVKITVSGVKISGTVQVEFPNRMRLKAGVMGMSEIGVDAGSNDQQFWVWSKVKLPNQKPAMYFANHREFQDSPLRRQMPLEPKWLMDAFGLIKLDPQGKHNGPHVDQQGRMRLYSSLVTENGTKSTRVLLISIKTGLIEQIAIYDSGDRLLAWADATRFRFYEEYNISLPHQIDLNMMQADQTPMKLKFEFGNYSINSLYGDPKLMWAIPNPGDDPAYDLGKAR